MKQLKKLKLNSERLKQKYVPTLEKQIKEHSINPNMFKFLSKKIKDSQTYQTYISEKLVEDEKMFKKLRINEDKDLKKTEKYSIKVENELKNKEEELKNVIDEIKKLKDNIKIKTEQMNESIEKIKEELKIKNDETIQLQDKYEKIKGELEYNVSQTQAQLKLSREKIELAKISLNSLTRDLKKKEELMESKPIRRTSSLIKNTNTRRKSLLGSPGKKRKSIVGVGSANLDEKKDNNNDILLQIKNDDKDKNRKNSLIDTKNNTGNVTTLNTSGK